VEPDENGDSQLRRENKRKKRKGKKREERVKNCIVIVNIIRKKETKASSLSGQAFALWPTFVQ